MIPILIPPVPNLRVTAGREMHLLLAQLMDNRAYVRFYREERARGAYLILDNGAHEHTRGEHIADLLTKSASVQAQEVVLPDVLFNASGTVESTIKALQYLESKAGKTLLASAWYPNLMVVPQGPTPHDFALCLMELTRAFGAFLARSDGEYTPHLTIGVSKDYETWQGGLYGLMKTTVVPCADEYNAKIHLLGWGRNLWAYREIFDTFGPRIRSIDTAKPFVYAAHGIALDPHKPAPDYPRRGEDYFACDLNAQWALMQHNVDVFDKLVMRQV